MAVIRRAGPGDVDDLVRIERESFPDPWSRNAILYDVAESERSYVAAAVVGAEDAGDVCEIGRDTVAGFADMLLIAGEAQLMNIAVDRRFRGRGYGRLLLEHMIDKARENKCEVMLLEVRRSNAAAIGLYTGLGFRQTGIRPHYYADDGEDAILMDYNGLELHEGR